MNNLEEHEAISLAQTLSALCTPISILLMAGGGLCMTFTAFAAPPIARSWIGVFGALIILCSGELIAAARYPKAPLHRHHRLAVLVSMAALQSAYVIPAIFVLSWSDLGPLLASLILCASMGLAAHLGQWNASVRYVAAAPAIAAALLLPGFNMMLDGAAHPDWLAMCMMWPLAIIGLFALGPRTVWRNARAARADGTQHQFGDGRRQADFIAMMSHDLRTPLTAIMAGASQIVSDSKGRHVPASARMIVDAGQLMHGLLTDLLDLAKIEAGKMTTSPRAIDLRRLTLDILRLWRRQAEEQGLSLRIEGARQVPPCVMGDPVRIRQVLNNLISNAIKFTNSGSVTLRYDQLAQQGQFSVIDTGPGLSQAQIDRLFAPYSQLESSTSGTGLGLVISSKLASEMGGALTVDSEPGLGTTFALRLPLPPVEIQRPASSLMILVVDDHEILRRALSTILEAAGYTAVLASGGGEALTLLRTHHFDAMVIDIQMPGTDGWATTRQLRASAGPNSQIPVIALTGREDEQDIAACRLAGMQARLMKPLQTEELLVTLQTVIEMPRARA